MAWQQKRNYSMAVGLLASACFSGLCLPPSGSLLAWAIPVAAELAEEVDSGLFVRLALSILDGGWLGAYDNQTLVKNAGYELVLAFCGWSGIRYQLVHMSLQVVAALLFMLAIRPLCRSPWANLIVYVFLLYTPLLFTTAFFRRIYRDGFVIAPSFALFAAYIAIYLRRDEPVHRLLPWALCGGISLGFLGIIKENSLWAMPFIGVCSLVIIVGWLIGARRGNRPASSCLAGIVVIAIPLVLSCAFPAALSYKNEQAYGASVTNERFQGGFSRACAELASIQSDADSSAIWISRQALADAIASSESLQSIEEELQPVWDRWATIFDGQEIYGDMAFWALRDGYRDAGGYVDAAETDAFWSKVADEITVAKREGRLQKATGLKVSAVSPPIPAGEVLSWLELTLKQCGELLTFTTMDTHLVTEQWSTSEEATPYIEDELRAREMLGGNTLLSGREDDTPERTRIANLTGKILGRLGVWASRAGVVLAVPTMILIFVRRKRLGVRRFVEVVLIVSGLLLSAFVFEAATCWYVAYQVPIFGWDRFVLEAYKYSPEFYVLIFMALCVLGATVLQCLCEPVAKGKHAR